MEQRVGRYQILDEIASGGQGAVYRAFDPDTGQIVALKVLHPTLTGDRQYIERFHREATLAASIVHTNVIKIFEVGEDRGRHFITMEFLPESLSRILQSGGAMQIDGAVEFAIHIAEGLGAAHALGIVHRDMKPQNVLISPDGSAKVTDFGIARAGMLSTMTATGAMLGTPHYMSPEQARGERADARTDVYSLGCVLYQMLTGELPFKGDTPLAVIRQHIDEQPRRVREIRQQVPRALASVVEQAMEKNPARRFQTASEMASALSAAVPRTARPSQRPHPTPTPSRPVTGPPPPPITPARTPPEPSTTWMSAWVKVWERTHRRRWAWVGTVISLTLALSIAAVRLGAVDEVRDFFDDLGIFERQEAPAGPVPTVTPVVAKEAQPGRDSITDWRRG